MQKTPHLAESLLGFELVGAARFEGAPHKKKQVRYHCATPDEK
jgi:hypothetical protein